MELARHKTAHMHAHIHTDTHLFTSSSCLLSGMRSVEGGGACSQAVITDSGCISVQCRREWEGVILGEGGEGGKEGE